MSFTAKMRLPNSFINPRHNHSLAGISYVISLPSRRRCQIRSLSVNSDTSTPKHFTATVGAPSISTYSIRLSQRHVVLLNVLACSVAVSATLLFCCAIPTLLAFKRAAESLTKLMDSMREELPGTMAAVRLSGMEISDLTAELSDLGQEFTQGVRRSTQAVRVAEERLRRMVNISPSASLQEITSSRNETPGPVLARTARGVREGIVKGRAMFGMFLGLVQFSRLALNYLAGRRKQLDR